MAATIYMLCALAALLCTVLLFQGFCRTRNRLLLWSSLSFAGLTLNNLFLVLDKLVFLSTDLSLLRQIPALIAMLLLLYGLIWEAQ